MTQTLSHRLVAAVTATLDAIAGGPVVEYAADAPSRVTSAGQAIVRDGEVIEEDRDLGPAPVYWRTLRVPVEIYAANGAAADRNDALDALIVKIQDALTADTSLGGLAESVRPSRDEMGNFGDAGAESLKAALINVDIEFQTTNPLD